MEVKIVAIEKPEEVNFILGQSHFIKTVEDVHEAIVQTAPTMKFGIAFCEASGKVLLRWSGNDKEMIDMAVRNGWALSAGHCFIIMLREGFPINILNAVKMIPEVVHIFCATANPTQVLIGETDQGRGILGVVDGFRTRGIETEDDIAERKAFLRTIGYKF
jgi:uncharacterized protein